jgi:hypothetical protein
LERCLEALGGYQILRGLPPQIGIEHSPPATTETLDGNDIVLQKFIKDFITPKPVLRTESIVWNGRKAWFPLPWAAIPEAQVQAIDEGFNNEEADARFCEFLNTRPDYTTAYILMRGIDGCSIDPGSWLFLRLRYPQVRIILAFSRPEKYALASDPTQVYFSRLDPHDGRLYTFLSLSALADNISGVSHDAASAWLLNQWTLGRHYGQQISMAKQTEDDTLISAAVSLFRTLKAIHRHRLPILS